MKIKKQYIILIHLVFWLVNVLINVEVTEHNLDVKIWSTLIYAGPFYFNYFALAPNLSQEFTLVKLLKWGFFYVAFTLIWFTVFWNLGRIEVLGLVDASSNIGGTVHLSFYFFAISTIGKLLLQRVRASSDVHQLYMEKKSHEINQLRSQMSFPFIEEVLGNLEVEAKNEPSRIVKPISLLAKVLRFKLYRKKEELILLSDEVEAINSFVQLYQFSANEKSTVTFTKDDWIEKGAAFLLIEDYLKSMSNSSSNDIEIRWEGEDVVLHIVPKIV